MKFIPNENVLRVALLLFSIVFGVLSVSLLVLGIVYMDELWWPKKYISLEFLGLPTLLIVLGSVSLVLAILGCFCAKSYSRNLFITFIVLLLLVLVLELTVAVISFDNTQGVSGKFKQQMTTDLHSLEFKNLESHYDCCGVTGNEAGCEKGAVFKMGQSQGCLDVVNGVVRTAAIRIGCFAAILALLRVLHILCAVSVESM